MLSSMLVLLQLELHVELAAPTLRLINRTTLWGESMSASSARRWFMKYHESSCSTSGRFQARAFVQQLGRRAAAISRK
jgi:hypothetical protein